MLRVISGNLKGKKLVTLPGKFLRPTSDRLRETIFNILSNYPRPSIVLDLFAGTGALGIEALSRGADFAVFIDYNPKSIEVISGNISHCLLTGKSRLIRWNIKKNLNCLKSACELFDMVFIDPPYDKNMVQPCLDHLFASERLSPEATIVVEHSISETVKTDNMNFQIIDERRYGRTVLSFLNPL